MPREAWRRILLHPTAKQESSAQSGTVAPRRGLSGESARGRHKTAKFKSQEQTYMPSMSADPSMIPASENKDIGTSWSKRIGLSITKFHLHRETLTQNIQRRAIEGLEFLLSTLCLHMHICVSTTVHLHTYEHAHIHSLTPYTHKDIKNVVFMSHRSFQYIVANPSLTLIPILDLTEQRKRQSPESPLHRGNAANIMHMTNITTNNDSENYLRNVLLLT